MHFNDMHDLSTILSSASIDNKITKLSLQIMLSLCFFVTLHQVVYVLHHIFHDKLNYYKKSAIKFIAVNIATNFTQNLLANVIVFLMKNFEAKRFLQSLKRE